MDRQDDIYSQKTVLLMHHMMASSCNKILSHHGLFLRHASVGKSSAHTNRGQPAKMAPGLCFRGLFTLEHPIGYISHHSSATAVWLFLFQKAFVCLFLTTCLEVQNKLKKLVIQKIYLLLM